MSVYLVTGGSGFIGSNIVRALLERKQSVKVLDNLLTGRKENIEDILHDIDFIEGDIRNEDDLDVALSGVDYVIHLGALPSVQRSVQNPYRSNDINVNGTIKLLDACKKHDIKRLVFASSSSVYGGRAPLPVKEEYKTEPISPYGLCKLTGEHYLRLYFELYGLETVALRYFNVFGPRQNPDSQYAAVIPKFITAMINDESPVIYGDGKQSRDFTYVDNVIEANILACTTTADVAGKVFNIACGKSIDLNELVDVINKALGKNIKPIYDADRKGDIKHSLASAQKAYEIMGFEPVCSVESGLEKTIEWYVANS